jgi:hypothetical protein
MDKPFVIQVFGKKGCQKCGVLNQRLDKLLAQPDWQTFEKQYCDVETEDGLVAFSEAECVNPQRIPGFIVTRRRENGFLEPVPNPSMGEPDPVCGKSRLYQFLGLQTDYSDSGKGLITPKMITTVLSAARN